MSLPSSLPRLQTPLWQRLAEIRPDITVLYERIFEETGGAPVVGVADLPFFRAVAVYDPRLARTILASLHREAPKNLLTRKLAALTGDGLLVSEGERWRRHRRLVQPAFSPDALDAYAGTMGSVVEGWIGRVRGQPFDLHREMMHLALTLVTRTLFGHSIEPHAALMERAMTRALRAFEGFAGTGLQFPAWVPTPRNLRIARSRFELHRIFASIIQDWRREGAVPDSLIGRLTVARDDEGLGFTDDDLRSEVLTLLVAGHETTASALSSALFYLARHRELADELHQEVASAGSVAQHRDLSQLPKTLGFVREILRLCPPAFLIARQCTDELELGGHRLPAGTNLLISTWVIQRDPRWFPEPLGVTPERWFAPTPEQEKAYLPFGLGPRACIGQRFALLELVVAVSAVMRLCYLSTSAATLPMGTAVTRRPREPTPLTLRLR